jgi:acyl-coenzyme A thioesterase PaaI-like protein
VKEKLLKTSKLSLTGESLLGLWERSAKLPFGDNLFSRFLGWAIPYTSSVSPRIEVLERGHAVVRLEDTRAVRNHLASVHAIALANIGEFSTGLALTSQMPDGMRAILGSLKIDYLKKARGRLKAEARCGEIVPGQKADHILIGEISDGQSNLVARVEAKWVVGPEKKAEGAAS